MPKTLSRPAVRLEVFIKGQPNYAFEVESIETSMGADRLDYAVISYNLGKNQPNLGRLQDLQLADLQLPTPQGNLAINGAEVTIVGRLGDKTKVFHWGKVNVDEATIGDESLQLVSRIDKAHFGKPLGFQRVFDPASGTATWNDGQVDRGIYFEGEVVFNPQIDGQTFGNKRVDDSQRPAGVDYPIFIHPDSVRTAAAAAYQKTTVSRTDDADRIKEAANENWNLVDAVLYLCGECNSDQQFIRNPSKEDLAKILPATRSILKNHKIRPGLYLCDALEALLEPYGYSFWIDYQSTSKRVLTIQQLGAGTRTPALHQRFGQVIDPAASNAPVIDIEYDVGQAINQVRAIGNYTYVESTFTLVPAWDRALDTVGMAYLNKDSPLWIKNPSYHRVWRDWVLNEAGDYQGSNPADLTALFRGVFGASHPPVVARRRKFLPTLTRGADNQPIGKTGGIFVEWWNPHKTGGAGWSPLWTQFSFFACRVLKKEAGISFTGAFPPIMIRSAGAYAAVRVTATIRSDSRLTYTSPRRPTSVNPDVNELVLDVPKRFHFRQLDSTSFFASDVAAGTRAADLSDGRDAIKLFADGIRDAWDQADCSGTIDLEGLDHPEYKLGNLVNAVAGRDVAFALSKAIGTDSRYAQIVGIRYHAQQQTTRLVLNSFRETDAWLLGLLRKTARAQR